MLRSRRLIRFIAPALLAGLLATGAAKADSPVRPPCDLLDATLCMLPFPNDYFTRPAVAGDPSATGKMVDFQLGEMPRNVAGKPIDPTEWNRNDGFSPGSMVLTFVPALDLHQTWGTADAFAGDPRLGGPNDPRDHIADIGRYAAADAPMLIIDQVTGERWPFWSELDTNKFTASPEAVLILRPAKNFLEGHRYLVGLRNLRTSTGVTIPAGPVFTGYRDGLIPGDRADHIRSVIGGIQSAETSRGNTFDASDLYLAWDFTIASAANLAGRILSMRDQSLALLGETTPGDGLINGDAPEITITSVSADSTDPNSSKLRTVNGTMKVPNFLDGDPYNPSVTPPAGIGAQSLGGRRLVYDENGMPKQNPAMPSINVAFVCTVPKSSTANPFVGLAHPTLYGHGLLGSSGESSGGSGDRDRERNFMPCATNWLGFSNIDVGNAVATLVDPSNFPTMADRSLQGFVNWIYLSRAIRHPSGFAALNAFKKNGSPVFDNNELYYDGNSQGGIMGGALCALSVDLQRCVLGVVGMNYSTLLNRSVDWENLYAYGLYTAFPNKIEQQLVMGILQMLWDRAEADGYAQHMTSDPLPNTPPHQVLMHAAYGDFQVTNVSAEVEARTIGARVMDTSLTVTMVDGAPRHWTAGGYPYFGLTPFDRSGSDIVAWNGSALVYWDSGNLRPPNGNVPAEGTGGDPHEDPRRDPRGGDQKAFFWLNGLIKDVMGGGAYLTCRPDDAKSSIPRVGTQFTIGDWCV